jgi:TP901 family phage tail tape measure protein
MDDNQLQFSGTLDIKSTLNNIQNQIKEIEKSLSPINVSLQINQDTIKQQTNQIQNQINNISKNVAPVSFSKMFTFNTQDTKQLFSQLDKYKEELSSLSKIAPAQYTTHTDGKNQIDSAKFTYYNDALKQTVTETYKVDTASQQAIQSINRMVLTGTTYSTNAYKAAQQTEKFNQQLQSFKNTVNSFGEKNISSLLDNNQLGTKYQSILNGLNSVSDSNGLTQVKNQFKELQTQTSQYANEQKVLQNETKTSYNTQIQELEILTKSEAQRQAALAKTGQQITKISADYDAFKAKLSPTDVGVSLGKLNSENVGGLENAINTQDVEKATYYLSLLRSEYTKLNNEVKKPWANNAIEKLPENIEKATNSISVLQSKFATLNTTGNSNFTNNFSSQIEKAKNNLNQLAESLDKINKEPNVEEQVKLYNNLSDNVQKTKVQVNDLVKAYQTLNRIEASAGSFEKYLQQNPQVLEKHAKQVNEIRNQWKQVSQETDITKLQTGFKEVNTSVSAFKGEIRSLGEEGRTVFGELGNDLKKQLQWLTSGSLLFGTIATIKKMADNVEDLSKSMVNLQIASGYNNDQMSSLMDTYSQMGQKMGATTTEVADSADAWLRQGKSVDESNTLIKDSMMLSKLGEIDSVQSTDYLTSAMKGYGVSVNNAVGIVDKLTKVDMESATSAGGLAEAMSKTANAANLAGVSMDQLLGMIAVVGETTQKSMDEVGTSFQAIFSRMGNVKAGKFVKDSESDVNDVETVLKKLGIQLRDSQGNFRNFGTVIDEIGNKWKSYSNLEQNAIATAVAGTRQRENFLVLMSNFNTALKYQETATNSAGTATQKYNDYTQGLEAHLKSATTAFQQLSRSVINSNTFSGLIDTGTGFLNILNTIVSKLGAIPTLIGAITAALSATKNVGKIYAYAA